MTTFAYRHRISTTTTEDQREGDLNAASAAVETNPEVLETTYPLQIPMWNIERVKVPQPLRNAEQLPRMRRTKSIIYSREGNSSHPHQSYPGRAGMRGYELTDVPALPPIVNEGELENCHVDTDERQDVLME